jgi:hypothetical protein
MPEPIAADDNNTRKAENALRVFEENFWPTSQLVSKNTSHAQRPTFECFAS